MEVSLQSFKKRFTYDPQKDLLGKGGFGEVYKAYDTEDHIFVALKISQGTADDKYNLINEIKRFKKLSHPNIVKHIEAYEVNTGSFDIHGKPIAYHVGILEYANNGTLADLLKKGTPDYRLIEDLAKDIIEGLAYLHSENIIHRDLKPTNILLFSEGEKLRAKITDFGIAKRTDATAASTQLVGTVEYMAPEFFSTGNITPTADVWSVGVMLLEALTGTHPFGKTTQGLSNEQIINNILNKDLSTATQNLLAPFKEIITRCLLRETNLRPQSATDLKGLLLQSGDTFSEKTQVIDTKFRNGVSERPKSKLKRWSATLFEFDLRNGKWKETLAREVVVLIIAPLVLLFGVFVFLSAIYPSEKNISAEFLKTKTVGMYYSLSNNGVYTNPIPDKETFVKRYSNCDSCYDLSQNYPGEGVLNDWLEYHRACGRYQNNCTYLSFMTHTIEEQADDIVPFLLFSIFIIFYPIRIVITVILWALHTLGFTFPSITERTSKAIKYSLLALVLLSFIGLLGYLSYSYLQVRDYTPTSIKKFDFSDAPANKNIVPPNDLPVDTSPISGNDIVITNEAPSSRNEQRLNANNEPPKKRETNSFRKYIVIVISELKDRKGLPNQKYDPNVGTSEQYDEFQKFRKEWDEKRYTGVSDVLNVGVLNSEKEYRICEYAKKNGLLPFYDYVTTSNTKVEINKFRTFEEALEFKEQKKQMNYTMLHITEQDISTLFSTHNLF